MVAFVQKAIGADNTGTSVASFSATMGAGFTAGNAIVGAMTWYGSLSAQSNISSISDGTKSYNVAASTIDYYKDSDNVNLLTIFLTGITSGATTITVTFSGTWSFCRLMIHEISAAGSIDGHGMQSALGTSSPVSPTVTANYASSASYGASSDSSQSGDAWTAGSGYTLENHNLTTDTTTIADEKENPISTGSISAGFTTDKSASDYITAILIIAPPQNSLLGSLALAGLVSANAIPEQFPAASLVGSGTLHGNVIPEQFVGASFGGTGSMTGTFLETAMVPGALTPSGTLIAPLIESAIVPASLAPTGNLTAALISSRSQIGSGFAITANLARIISQGLELAAIPTVLAGTAGLSSNALGPWQFLPTSLTPAGSLSPPLLAIDVLAATLAGAGLLSTQGVLLGGHIQGVVGALGAASGALSATGTGISPIASGSTVVGAVIAGGVDHFINVTDDQGNTYTPLGTYTDGSNGAFLHTFWLPNITNGPITLTANYASPGVTTPQIVWDEYYLRGSLSGFNGQIQVGPGTATDAITSGTISTGRTSTVWGITASYAGFTTATPGTSFLAREQDAAAGHWGLTTEDQYVASAATVAATFTSSAGINNWATAAVALSPPSQLLAASLASVGGISGSLVETEIFGTTLVPAASVAAPMISRLSPASASLSPSILMQQFWSQQTSALLNGIITVLGGDVTPIYPQVAAGHAPVINLTQLGQPLLAIPVTLTPAGNLAISAALVVAVPASLGVLASMVHAWPVAQILGGAIGEQTIGDEPIGWDIFGYAWPLATAFSVTGAFNAELQPLHGTNVAATLTPSGSLIATAILIEQIVNALAPSGGLTASLFEAEAIPASFVGSGMMVGTVANTEALAAALAPSGTLIGNVPTALNFGLSALSAAVVIATAALLDTAQAGVALGPAAAINAGAIEREQITAALLSPIGTLFAALLGGKTGTVITVNLAPSGVMTATMPASITTSPMAVSGSLTASSQLLASIATLLAGTGAISTDLLLSQLSPNAMLVQTGFAASLLAEDLSTVAMTIIGRLTAYLNLITQLDFAAAMPPGYALAPQGAAAPLSSTDLASATYVRRVVDVVNNMMMGKLNVTMQVTLRANATSTTIIDARIGAYSVIMLMPVTADASAIAASVYVSSQQNGQATISHPSTANIDQNFRVMIIG